MWEWLGDSFSYSKLLAGDGGKGKSSIAYEFAEKVCDIRPYEFEQVIWLTGKKKQFIGIQNEYQTTPEVHFHNLESLLCALGAYLGVLEGEMKDISINILKQKIRGHLKILPAFIVIDDVDSLDRDEQRKVMETVMQLSGRESKILLTTRMNLVYSTDLCITVPGLIFEDYENLVDIYYERFRISKLSNKQIKIMHSTTDGSPLFTESLLRLIRIGASFHRAINKWKGESGDDVRRAALKREIDTLSPESRRILYVLSLMTEASATELRQIVGCQMGKFEISINDLSSLFLISSPPIIETEKRFRVSKNTSLLVTQGTSIVTNPEALKKKVKEARVKKIPDSNRSKIGAVINQAFALLKDSRGEEALKTVNTLLSKIPNNKDLLFLKARCLMAITPKDLDAIRKFYHLSFSNGQRKPEFFDYWYNAELEAKDPTGLIEVSKFALENSPSNIGKWLINSAVGYKYLSDIHKSTSNYSGAIENLIKASEYLSKAINKLSGNKKDDAISHSKSISEELWLLSSRKEDMNSLIQRLDIILNIIAKGDLRNMWYYRAENTLKWIIKNTDNITPKWVNFTELQIKRLRTLVAQRNKHESANEMYIQITSSLNSSSNLVADWSSSIEDKELI